MLNVLDGRSISLRRKSRKMLMFIILLRSHKYMKSSLLIFFTGTELHVQLIMVFLSIKLQLIMVFVRI